MGLARRSRANVDGVGSRHSRRISVMRRGLGRWPPRQCRRVRWC
jgi:hypothetical protein